jgi:hypothetical protein
MRRRVGSPKASVIAETAAVNAVGASVVPDGSRTVVGSAIPVFYLWP